MRCTSERAAKSSEGRGIDELQTERNKRCPNRRKKEEERRKINKKRVKMLKVGGKKREETPDAR